MSAAQKITATAGDIASQTWSKGGNAYLATQHLMLPLSREVNRLVGENMGARAQGLKILDVACGTGEPSATFAETFPNAQIVATDFAPGMIEVAKGYTSAKGINNIKFAVADAQDLSAFDSDSFDVVSCVAAIFMVPDPKRALAEFKRVLRPGGKCFVTAFAGPEQTNFATSVFTAMSNLLPKAEEKPKPKSLELFKPEVFKETVLQSGFENVSISDFNCQFSFTETSLEDFQEHPMMQKVLQVLAQDIPKDRAYLELCKEIKAIAKTQKWTDGDHMTFPTNLSYIIVAGP